MLSQSTELLLNVTYFKTVCAAIISGSRIIILPKFDLKTKSQLRLPLHLGLCDL